MSSATRNGSSGPASASLATTAKPTEDGAAVAALLTALLVGFESNDAERLSGQLRASRKLSVIGAAVSWLRAGAAIELHEPAVAVVCNESADLVELAALARQRPQTRVAVLGRGLADPRARALIAGGAATVLSRDLEPWLQVYTVVAAAHGFRPGIFIPHERGDAVVRRDARLALLTPREQELLEFLKEPRSIAEIAAAMGLRKATARTHAESIYGKLGVRGRAEARRLAASLDGSESFPRLVEAEGRASVPFVRRDRARWAQGWARRPLLHLAR